MEAIFFEEDDVGYLNWIRENPDGFVVNMRDWLDPTYLVLHRATCLTINSYPDMQANPGGFTEKDYRKLCGGSVEDLKEALRQRTDGRHSFSKNCSQCGPE